MSGIGETTTFAHAGKIVATALHAKCEVQAAEINRLERERDELLAALKEAVAMLELFAQPIAFERQLAAIAKAERGE